MTHTGSPQIERPKHFYYVAGAAALTLIAALALKETRGNIDRDLKQILAEDVNSGAGQGGSERTVSATPN
jgi:hypothetical protein